MGESEMASATQGDEGKAGFQVRYEVRETNIGKGLSLLEPVAKGALIWRYREGENILCFPNEAETRKHLDSMASDADRKYFLSHAYHDGGALNFILDDGGLWNHSDKPNTGGGPDPLSSYAIRDLDAGDELRDDYATSEHPPWLVALCRE